MIIGIDASRANKEIKTGVEWYSYHLIENLKKIDTENHYFLYSEEKLKNDLVNLPLNWQSKVLSWPLKFIWTQIRLSWEMFINPPDLLFIPSHVIPLIHPKKVVTTIHDLGFKRFPEAYSFFQRWYQDFSVKFALKHATKIIVPSEFTKKELMEIYQADPKKLIVIHLAYNAEIFSSDDNPEKSAKILGKYNIKKPYLLYVGRLENKKNISFLIDVFENLSLKENSQLVLVGNGGYGYEKIKDKIKKSKFKDRIIQLPWINEEELAILYREARVFVFPSLYEGFGIPLLEAMTTSTPIVASNIASIPEIVKDAALMPRLNDLKNFTDQIKKAWEDENLRNELKNRGLERIKSFNWEKTSQETLNLFSTLK